MAQRTKILIVDNEPLNVTLFAAALFDSYEIISAFNGEQALQTVAEELPDLIILNILTQDIDGLEVTRRLRSNSETVNIPIILITAPDDFNYKIMGHEAGVDEFLDKPIQPLEVKSLVKSIIYKKKYKDKLTLWRQVENDKSSVLILVEDNNEAQQIKAYLHGQPYQVIIKNTAKETVDLCNQGQVDVVLLGAMNDGGRAFEACIRLKERKQTANIQVLGISDLADLEKNRELFDCWLDNFLIRPINANELMFRVNALLKKKTYLDTLYTGPEDSICLAISDSFSGLAKYSYFKYFLEHEIKRYRRDSKPVSLLMMEISGGDQTENFSEHPDGYKLIKNLGTLIRENIRDIDLGAHCAENKFAVVLVNTDDTGANIVAKRLKHMIENQLSICTEKLYSKWSFNHGIAVCPSDADSTELLIDKAEKMLVISQREPDKIKNCA